jgi:acyl-CoA thioesterase-1
VKKTSTNQPVYFGLCTIKFHLFILALLLYPLANPLNAQVAELWEPIPLNPATAVLSSLDQTDTNRRNLITQRVANASNVDLIIIGNSITHYWEWNTYAESYGNLTNGRNVLNMGLTAEVTPGMLHSLLERGNGGWTNLPQGVKPKVIMIMAGTNNCFRSGFSGMQGHNTPPAEVADGIRAITQVFARKFSTARVINLGIFPNTLHDLWGPINKISADYYDNKQVFHLNLQDRFLNSDSTVNLDLFKDGIHPNNDGYNQWVLGADQLLTDLLSRNPLNPVKIMHMGGSITEGLDADKSYRRYMDPLIRQAGNIVDFVGSRTVHNGSKPKYYHYDWEHEAKWGQNSAELAQRAGLLTGEIPDIVVIHTGTEDILTSSHPIQTMVKNTITNIGLTINTLRARNPAVKIVLAKIIPIAGKANEVNAMNAEISSYIMANSTSQSPMLVADQFNGFNISTHLSNDGVLPNAAGALKMAKIFAEAVNNLIAVPTTDCNGELNGTASVDNCNVCSGGNTGIVANSSCKKDCNGDASGVAYLDACNICVGGSTGKSKIVNGIPEGYSFLGNEGDTKTLPTKSDVVYGASCNFAYVYGVSGSVAINNATFGDPAPGQVKKAYYKPLNQADCNGVAGGSAYLDSCNYCVGGNTGDTDCLAVVTSINNKTDSGLNIYPNPVHDQVNITGEFSNWTLTDSKGAFIKEGTEKVIDVAALSPGVYYLNVDGEVMKFIKI